MDRCSQTEEILKEWLFTLPAHHLSPVVLLLSSTGRRLGGTASQAYVHLPRHGHRSKLGPLDISLSWKKDWKWSVHSFTPAVEWNYWFPLNLQTLASTVIMTDMACSSENGKRRPDYITLLYSHSTTRSPSIRPTSPFLSPRKSTFQFPWKGKRLIWPLTPTTTTKPLCLCLDAHRSLPPGSPHAQLLLIITGQGVLLPPPPWGPPQAGSLYPMVHIYPLTSRTYLTKGWMQILT